MGRPRRVAVGGLVYHVLNRANGRVRLFRTPRDYEAFEEILIMAHERVRMRTIAYCVMPNHWHFVLWPRKDGDLTEFMRWLTLTHAQRWHASHDTVGTGHLYQGRFKSFPIQSDKHYLTVCRYVERNPVRAGLVERAQDWRWGSPWRRRSRDAAVRSLLSAGPMSWPKGWLSLVNRPQTEREEDEIRASIRRGRPFGDASWTERVADQLGLASSIRPVGRPRKP